MVVDPAVVAGAATEAAAAGVAATAVAVAVAVLAEGGTQGYN